MCSLQLDGGSCKLLSSASSLHGRESWFKIRGQYSPRLRRIFKWHPSVATLTIITFSTPLSLSWNDLRPLQTQKTQSQKATASRHWEGQLLRQRVTSGKKEFEVTHTPISPLTSDYIPSCRMTSTVWGTATDSLSSAVNLFSSTTVFLETSALKKH